MSMLILPRQDCPAEFPLKTTVFGEELDVEWTQNPRPFRGLKTQCEHTLTETCHGDLPL